MFILLLVEKSYYSIFPFEKDYTNNQSFMYYMIFVATIMHRHY